MSPTFDVALEGIRPEPLGSYLKALAVLRLVAEQKDTRAAGYWRSDVFHLVSTLDREALLAFFAREYAPTPIIGPWGARSGFFPGSSESSAREALNAIAQSETPRLAAFREVIFAVRALLERKGLTSKAKDEDKIELLADLRNELPESALPWLDAAYVLGARDERGQLSRAFPPILGTGGNEGSQGYSSTFMQALVDVGITRGEAREPRSALFGEPEEGLATIASGQYLPGRAGGFNQGHGFSGPPAPMSAWEMVLLFEGAATWVSGPSTRHGARAIGRESSPFTVRQRSVDGSAVGAEEGKARAELWAPIWERPTRWAEITALLAEARMHIGHRPARDTLEMARAATSLGVDRGIASFVRYPILVRNGRTYFAFAIGRFEASERPEAELVGSLDEPLGRLDAAIRREKNPPARLVAARRAVAEAMFELLRTGEPVRCTALLRAIGRLDRTVARWSGGRTIRPLSGLSPAWLERAERSAELRIAAAIASIQAHRHVGPFRANLISVDPERPDRWAEGEGQRAWRGPTLAHRLAGALSRRMLDTAAERHAGNPLRSVICLAPSDVAAFLEGRVDDGELEDLVHALTWVNWADAETEAITKQLAWWRSEENRPLPAVYALLKLCFWPGKIRDAYVVPEPALLPLLLAGRLVDACRIAYRRLRAHGLAVVDLASTLDALAKAPVDPVRLAGSLIVPIAHGARDDLIRAVSVMPRREESAR